MAKKVSAPDDLLGPIEHLVMKAVMELGENDAYGMEVFDTIGSGYPPISFGSVYTALERLTWKGYLETHMSEPEAARGGRARKYFRPSRQKDASRDVLSSALPMRIVRRRKRPPAYPTNGDTSE
jgi:PadR family transcriptional regulator PadR